MARRARRMLAWALFLVLAVVRPVSAQVPVDLQLVLAIDVSSSVDFREFSLEIEGYAQAFRHPDVQRAIRAGPTGRIAVIMVQWAGRNQQKVAIDWTIVGDSASADRFAAEIMDTPRLIEGATALGEAVLYAVNLFDEAPFPAPRRAIDVSGDGMNNEGQIVSVARDAAAGRGITINGLAIINEEKDLESHYREFLITGPNAFVIVARDFESFTEAVVKKLIREITGELVSEVDPAYPDRVSPRIGLAEIPGP
jgi:hypothetical protein